MSKLSLSGPLTTSGAELIRLGVTSIESRGWPIYFADGYVEWREWVIARRREGAFPAVGKRVTYTSRDQSVLHDVIIAVDGNRVQVREIEGWHDASEFTELPPDHECDACLSHEFAARIGPAANTCLTIRGGNGGQ
jgi:hypothetical protein